MQKRYYKEIHFDQLRAFCTVARRGSFQAASKELNRSRTTVWQQIDALERHLKARLLRRRGRRVELTDDGRLLLELGLPTVTSFESITQIFQERVSERPRILPIVTITGVELDEAIECFRKQCPHVSLALKICRSPDVYRAIEDGEATLGFASQLPLVEASPWTQFRPVGERSFLLATPRHHPLTRLRRLRLAELAKYPLITFTRDNPLRKHLERVFEVNGLRATFVMETDSVETVERYVHLGLGVGICTWTEDYSPRGPIQVRSLRRHFGALPVGLVWKRGAVLPPEAALFVRLVVGE
jgi:DNA-binding transcriptional LysR family regulator